MISTEPSTSGANAFDFLVGSWTVANRRLRRPLSGGNEWEAFPARSVCWALFGGAANIEQIEFPTRGFRGVALRLFDVEREEWSINWADDLTGRLHPPVLGRFTGSRGEFHGLEKNGADLVPCRLTWSEITADSVRWEQAFQAPDGIWEPNWVMEFRRAGD
jgi:hypothetical protein